MKTFNRTYLPEQIKYNGKIYKVCGNPTLTRPEKNFIKVLVLSRNLKGRTDLYGNLYKPTEWYFKPI